MKRISLIIGVTILTTLACGLFGSKLPEYNGVYYISDKGFIEIEMSRRNPKQEEYSILIETENQPKFLFYEPSIRIDTMMLFNISTGGNYSFSYKIESNDVVKVDVDEKLDTGIYCFDQGGDIFSIPGESNKWCFSVGKVVVDSQENVLNQEIISHNEENTKENQSIGQMRWSQKTFSVSLRKSLTGDFFYHYSHMMPYSKNIFLNSGNESKLFFPTNYAFDLEKVYFTDIEDGAYYLMAIDNKTGNKLWQFERVGHVIGLGDNTVFFLTDDNRIYGLDKNTGTEIWKIFLDLVVDENSYYYLYPKLLRYDDNFMLPITMRCPGDINDEYDYGYSSLRFMHIDENTGEIYITPCNNARPEESKNHFVPLIYSNGRIFATNSSSSGFDSSFIILNVTDGSVIWKLFPPYSNFIYSYNSGLEILDIDLNNKILFFRSTVPDSRDIKAINFETGNMLWVGGLKEINKISDDLVRGSIWIKKDYIVVDPRDSNNIFIFNKQDGKLINTFTPDRSSYKIHPTENGFVIYYDIGVSVGIDYLSGNRMWQDDETKYFIDLMGSTYYYVFKDILMIQDINRDILAVDNSDGTILWNKEDLSLSNIIGDVDNYITYVTKEALVFLDPIDGSTKEVALNNDGSSSSHIEMVDESSWIICGNNLIWVDIH